MTVTIDLERNPFFREAVERVRRHCRIESIGIVLRARFPESRPEDLSRLEALSQDELNEMLRRSAIAASAEEALAVPLTHLLSVDARTRPGASKGRVG